MEVLIHFVFQLIKIPLQASIYALLVVLIATVIKFLFPASKFANVFSQQRQVFKKAWLFITVGLFIFSFTYWGDHGLGDSSRIPIGNGKSVYLGGSAYIDLDTSQVYFNHFTYDSKRLYASNVETTTGRQHDLLVYDLEEDRVTFYNKEEDYLKVAKAYVYPLPDTFEDFEVFYNRYWNGWRFFMLP
jgi:hypothetical protein